MLILKIKEKIKFGLKHPKQVPYHIACIFIGLFQNKSQQSVKFFKDNYYQYKPKFLLSKLEKYWNKYRYFAQIKKLIGANRKSFAIKKILDVGCGFTSVLNILPESERYGIDIVIDGLKKGKFKLDKNIKWINGPGEKLPFKKNFFDIVICSNGIDHYEDPNQALSEIKRVLKKNGFFVLTIDVFNKDLGYRNRQHPHSYTEEKILNQLRDFKILFKKTSTINAQFVQYIKNRVEPEEGEKELILVMKLK